MSHFDSFFFPLKKISDKNSFIPGLIKIRILEKSAFFFILKGMRPMQMQGVKVIASQVLKKLINYCIECDLHHNTVSHFLRQNKKKKYTLFFLLRNCWPFDGVICFPIQQFKFSKILEISSYFWISLNCFFMLFQEIRLKICNKLKINYYYRSSKHLVVTGKTQL